MRENIMTAEQYEKKNMVEALKRNACTFEFTKKDGSLRQMIATLNSSIDSRSMPTKDS